jgi:hypothetical protein
MTNRIIYSHTGVVFPTRVTAVIETVSVVLNNHHVALPHHRKILRISIEALQNQARHGKCLNYATKADTSFFILNEREDSYTITTGNYICTSDIPSLEKKLIAINAATNTEITQRFRVQLKHGIHFPEKGAGLGLLDMRRKSGTNLTFTFQKSTPNYSFFHLTITVLRSDQPNHHQ